MWGERAVFWKKRPTVDAETEAWLIECWQWLDRTIPAHDDKTGGELILPSRTRFPETDKQGFERASYYFDLVRDYCGMREWPCKLVAQAASPDLGNSVVFGGGVAAPGPLGTFQATGNAAVITYDPAQLNLKTAVGYFRPTSADLIFNPEVCQIAGAGRRGGGLSSRPARK